MQPTCPSTWSTLLVMLQASYKLFSSCTQFLICACPLLPLYPCYFSKSLHNFSFCPKFFALSFSSSKFAFTIVSRWKICRSLLFRFGLIEWKCAANGIDVVIVKIVAIPVDRCQSVWRNSTKFIIHDKKNIWHEKFLALLCQFERRDFFLLFHWVHVRHGISECMSPILTTINWRIQLMAASKF